jgi:hypothetical protein
MAQEEDDLGSFGPQLAETLFGPVGIDEDLFGEV